MWAHGGEGALAPRHWCRMSAFGRVAAAAPREFGKKTTNGCVGVWPSHYRVASECFGPR